MSARTATPTLRAAGVAGRVLVGLAVVYAALAIRLVVETVSALLGDDFLGVLGVVLGGGILLIVFQLFVLLAVGHFSLGRRFLRGDPVGYPLAIAMLVVDVLHFGLYGWFRLGPQRDITWINAWTDHEASLRRQGVVYLVFAAVALVGVVALVRWIRRARSKPVPTVDFARSASTQAVVVALMVLNVVTANEVVLNRRVALRFREAQHEVDGQVRWRFPVPSSSPVATRGGGLAFFAGYDAEMSAINETSGALMWSASVSPGVLGLAYGAGTVFVSDYEGVVALNAGTGERRWEVGSTGDMSTCLVQPPVADGSAVYVMATQRGGNVTQLQALEPVSGRERWRFSWDGSSFCGGARNVGLGGDVVVLPGAGGGDGLTALDASNGEVRWRTELDGFPEGPAAVAGDSVYTATAGGRYIYALELSDGSVRWRKDLGFSGRGPVVADDDVVIVKKDGLLALDAAAGATVWEVPSAEDVVMPVILTSRFVYAVIGLGTAIRLRTLERTTGREFSCIGIPEPSVDALAIGSPNGATVVSRHVALAIEPKRLSSSTLETLHDFTSPEQAPCPAADGT